MATCSNVSNRANSMDFNQNMPLSECMCPICMSILVEPVTLPCKHELCMPCFRMNIHETSMTCPMCRIRIATWSRQATRKNTLVNQKRWSQIKRLFPEQVNKRLAGMDDEEDLLRDAAVTPSLSEPGEIRREYEEEKRKIEEEKEKQRQEEQAASEALIKKLQEEENQLKESWKKRKTKQEEVDEVVARDLAGSLNEPRVILTRKRGLMDKFVVRSPAGSRPESTELTGSGDAPSDQPSTSKTTTFNDFFQPRTKSKQTSGWHDIRYVGTNCLSTDVKSRPVTSKSDPGCEQIVPETGEALPPETEKPAFKPKVSETAETVHSFIDQSKIQTVDTSGKTEISEQPGTSKSAEKPVSRRADSTDSISQELVHFQPIQTCPRTPPKWKPSGRMVHAPVIKCKPLNIPSPDPPSPAELTSKSKHHSPVIRRQVALLEAQRLVKVGEQSKGEQTDTNILHNRSPSSPFRTISIGQKRRHGIQKSAATKKLRFDLGGSDASDTYNIVNNDMVNCLRKKLDKPEVIIIDSESTQSSCVIIEEKSTMKPHQNGALQKTTEWLDSMGDENNSENSEGGAMNPPKREPAPVYVMAHRLKFNPPRESPAVTKNIDDWLKRSQAETENQFKDPLRVHPTDTARRCFSNPGRSLIPVLTKEDVLKRAAEEVDRSKSVCAVLKEQRENRPPIRTYKQPKQTSLVKGKKVPNKDVQKPRTTKNRNPKQKNSNKGKSKGKVKGKVKKANNRVISPTSGEEAGLESDEDPDVKYARQLQRKFDLEAKRNMTVHKLRGTAEDYSFRKRRPKSESSS